MVQFVQGFEFMQVVLWGAGGARAWVALGAAGAFKELAQWDGVCLVELGRGLGFGAGREEAGDAVVYQHDALGEAVHGPDEDKEAKEVDDEFSHAVLLGC